MSWLELSRWLHLIGASVLLGTGSGIAFFMLMANRTGDPNFIARTAHTVILADWVFTASAVLLQPLTGTLLALQLGWPLTQGWIVLSVALYVLTGLFWLPVVWIQVQLARMAQAAADVGSSLPPRYGRLFRIWWLCGIPAFLAVLTIFYLMSARPLVLGR